MSDADACRLLASEHHLEFIDLESTNIDPTAASVLPASVARRHQVVPIRQKLGTPVIALSNPDDVMTSDTIRATIGREFIAVVASPDQITVCLDRLYGLSGPGTSNGHPVAADSSSIRQSDVPGTSSRFAAVATEAGTGTSTGNGNGTGPRTGNGTGKEKRPPGQASPPPSSSATASTEEPPAPELPPLDQLPPPAPQLPAFDQLPPLGPAPSSPQVEDLDLLAGLPLLPAFDPLANPAASFVGDTQIGNGKGTGIEDRESTPTVSEEASVPGPAEKAPSGNPSGPGPHPGPHAGGEPHSRREIDPAPVSFPPLARILVEGGRVSLKDMTDALEEHDSTGLPVTRILATRKLATESDLMWGMAEEMGLEFVDLDMAGINIGAALLIPESTARHHNVLIIGDREGVPVIAASNPTNVFAMDDLRTIIGRNFVTVVATRSQIEACLNQAYSAGGDAAEAAITASREVGTGDFEVELDNIAVADDAPIVRYANLLILQAINERASDIHVEPTAHDLRIRYRVDGVLHDSSSAPRSIAASVTTRLKVLANMNIAEHRIPQDGRISLNVGSRQIDLRMATLPTIHGEKVVMRVLDKSSVALSFEDLGFDQKMLDSYREVYTKPYGTIFVTGPTGSGKTTTLYATLLALNTPERNIITVEDPVELQIKGISQVQLNVKAGLTFASALRSMLRSDPDVVLVGEVRDRETAVIAIEASLTGHLVLTTLHTNSSASAPMRLVEMGLEPYLVTSAVAGVIAQRLARKLCANCKEPYEPSEADLVAAGWSPEDVLGSTGTTKLFRAVGCSSCMGTGYRGRKALVEFLAMNEDIERMILEGGSAGDINRLAVSQGMVTLRQSGLRKALEGETTLEEILRVVI